jgi:spore coat polysaccharide biosynthesis protein SpsF
VLDRFYQAARTLKAEAVVRITADCPLIDPQVVDQVVQTFLDVRPDYASNCLERTYPRGLDAEVMTLDALERAWKSATEPSHRAHVTPYLYENPALFKLASVKGEQDYSQHRWTVDTAEDLEFVRAVYAAFTGEETFGWQDVLRLLDARPELSAINRHVVQKALHEG